jgi:hypothetical protein
MTRTTGWQGHANYAKERFPTQVKVATVVYAKTRCYNMGFLSTLWAFLNRRSSQILYVWCRAQHQPRLDPPTVRTRSKLLRKFVLAF